MEHTVHHKGQKTPQQLASFLLFVFTRQRSHKCLWTAVGAAEKERHGAEQARWLWHGESPRQGAAVWGHHRSRWGRRQIILRALQRAVPARLGLAALASSQHEAQQSRQGANHTVQQTVLTPAVLHLLLHFRNQGDLCLMSLSCCRFLPCFCLVSLSVSVPSFMSAQN